MKTKDIVLIGALIGGGLLLYKMFKGDGFLGGGGGSIYDIIPYDPGLSPPLEEMLPMELPGNQQDINIQGIMPTKTNYGAVKVYPTVTDYLTSKGVTQIYRSRLGLGTPQAQMQMQLSQKLTPISEPKPSIMQQRITTLYDVIKKGRG